MQYIITARKKLRTKYPRISIWLFKDRPTALKYKEIITDEKYKNITFQIVDRIFLYTVKKMEVKEK